MWRAQLRTILTSSTALAALVAIASWNVVFVAPAPGNDGSWSTGLYIAAEQGLRFGEEVVFTYGPLGFLSPLTSRFGGVAVSAYGGLAQLAFAYGAIVHLLLCVSLVLTLRRRLAAPVAVILSFLLVAGFPAIHRPFAVAVIWCLLLLTEDPRPPLRRFVIFGGAGLASIELLIRPTTGAAILAMYLITLIARGRAERRDLIVFGATFLTLLAALWVASGQGLGNVPDFIASTFQLVSEYSQAMPYREAGLKWDLAAIAGALAAILLIAGGLLTSAGRRRRIAASMVLGVAAFSVFKEGVVREDSVHLSILFATALALAVATPVGPAWRLPAAGFATGLAVLALVSATPAPEVRDFNPLDHADSFVSEVRTLGSADRREELANSGKDLISLYSGLDPGTQRLLSGRPVASIPSGASVVWAYGLSWEPLPVFQSNLAYSEPLEQRNVDALESLPRSGRVLSGTPEAIDPFSGEVTDDRNPAWNPPAVAIALLCRFRPVRTTSRWQVLRRHRDRCGEPRPLGSVESAYGEEVEVPSAGPKEAVLARIHGVDVSGLERLRAFLFRARLRYAILNGGDAIFRLVPGTAGGGLLMSVPASLDLPPPFSLSARARTIELSGADGKLRFDFYALPLSSGS